MDTADDSLETAGEVAWGQGMKWHFTETVGRRGEEIERRL